MRATTGYSTKRAAPHDRAVKSLVTWLRERGYECGEQPLDGHRPDIRLHDDGDYIDVKVGTPNLAIEIDSYNCYQQIQAVERRRVYIVHVCDNAWWVHTPNTLQFVGGPRRATSNGSNDDWYLATNSGTPLADFFPLKDPA